MAGQFVVGDSGTWVTPEGTIDADLPDDRWYAFAPTATFSEPAPEPGAPPETVPGNPDVADVSDKPPLFPARDEWAAQLLTDAWQKTFGTAPNPVELQAVQAIARGESTYGWPDEKRFPEWQGHHNWGSCHCMMRSDGKLKPCDKDGVCVRGFMGSDKINGVRKPVCFASFPTNLEGAMHYLKTLLVQRPGVRAVIGDGDAYRIALEMRKTSYFMTNITHDMEAMKADAVAYSGLIMRNAANIAKNRNTKMLLHVTVPEKVKPTPVPGNYWPHETTDMEGYSPPGNPDSTLGPIAGVAFGIGLGALGIWGYKKWIKR